MNEVKLEVVSTDDPLARYEDAQEELMKQIAAQKILIREENKLLRRIEKQNLEDFPNKFKDRDTKIETIKNLTDKLIELELDLKGLQRSAADANEDNIQAALMEVDQRWIKRQPTAAYVINDQEFVFIKDYSSIPEKQNVQLRTMEPARFVELLANELDLRSWHLPPTRVKDLFNETGRTYQLSRYSVEPNIWNKDDIYLPIQHMEPFFINHAELNSEQQKFADESLGYFNMLMYSLSGGRAENQEHIERWILHKIINYRKAVTTPDLVIVGHVGGNGKGILQAIIRLMLPAMLSGKANSKTLNGNFNAIMLGKLIVFFDDQNSREIPLEVVKQLAGSETMIFEPKGKDQYEGEKTHSSAWFSNTLPFRLTPAGQEGGVDRRFSIMRTSITFLESLRIHLERESKIKITVEESKDIAESVVSEYLLNRLCVANWFKSLQKKYPDVDVNYTLKPLHGEDYNYFLQNQRNSFEIIWHNLITPRIKSGSCVPMFVVKELLRHMEGNIPGGKVINAKFRQLAAENRMEIAEERTTIEITPYLVSGKKQCTVLRSKNPREFTDKTFDWSLVSNLPYTVPGIGREWIAEDNLIFNIKNSADDDFVSEEESDNDFDFREQSERTARSWEEE